MFITFKDEERCDKEGNPMPKATLHILPPIYIDESLSPKENKSMLMDKAFLAMKEQYELTYGIPLEYSVDELEEEYEDAQSYEDVEEKCRISS